ncbi:MAG: hypothetical protein LBR41_01125 [Rickettsiales bacterium]|jgi:hypothetical protein|nr:hypothetical protein [Rickettsiales bacterium]
MTPNEFFELEKTLIESGADSDRVTFAEIKQNLMHPKKCTPDEFAHNVIYVILASGFSQKTAKVIYGKIISRLEIGDSKFENLFSIFKNKNKINAICDVWENRKNYAQGYYALCHCEERSDAAIHTKDRMDCRASGDARNDTELLEKKLAYLATLPHIGKITANHLARNLGENVFKRDVWIDRLLKKHGPDFLENLSRETNLPIGYIDVVLWKALQIGVLKI